MEPVILHTVQSGEVWRDGNECALEIGAQRHTASFTRLGKSVRPN